MIAVSGCVECNTAADELQPVGWTRVSVIAGTRVVDTPEGKREIHTRTKQFYFCDKCFESWWKGGKGV
jgi:hypothetical protein